MKPSATAALAALLLACGAAQAATYAVTKTADSADGACDADCSLREAVIAANASPGADEVALGAGNYALTLGFATSCPVVCDPDCTVCEWEVADETTGDLDVTDDLTIRGAGADATVLDQQFQDRVLRLTSGAVVLGDLTVSGGERGGYTKSAFGISASVAGQGGGVLIEPGASLDLLRAEVRGNYARAGGGCQHGICAITGGEGGGVLARGPLTAEASSIVENSVENGNNFLGFDSPAKGAGLSLRAASSFVNSTISGNVRAGSWGTYPPRQVHVRGVTASFESCTLVAAGGGAALETGEPAAPPPGTTTNPATAVELRNTLLGVAGCTADAASQTVSLDYNLDQDGSCGLSGAADLSGVDPLLGPLQDLGGPTRV